MIFQPAQPVLWNCEPCTVAMVCGESVALTRARDGFTIITNVEALAGHQPQPERLPRASLLGEM